MEIQWEYEIYLRIFRNHLAVSGMKVLTAPSEPFGPGQSDQADLYAGDGDQHVGTGGQGCSGGQYVIDQHDMLVLQGGQSFIGQGKQVFCVEPPFVAVLVGLGRIMVNAVQGIRADGDAGKGRDSSGQQFALVVAACALTPGVEGNGDQAVYPFEESGRMEFGCQQFPHPDAGRPCAVVFHVMQEGRDFASPGIIAE